MTSNPKTKRRAKDEWQQCYNAIKEWESDAECLNYCDAALAYRHAAQIVRRYAAKARKGRK